MMLFTHSAEGGAQRPTASEIGSGLALVDMDGRCAAVPLGEAGELGESRLLGRILPLEAANGGAVLIGPVVPALRINGERPLPVAALRDRDEIVWRGTTMVVGAYAGAAAARLVGRSETEHRCARCTRPITQGSVVRNCPVCRAAYHSSEVLVDGTEPGRGCFDYDPACLGCGRTWASIFWTEEGGDGDR